MQRVRISRSDFLFGLMAVAVPGATVLVVLSVMGAVAVPALAIGAGLTVLAAGAVALAWARDVASLRLKAERIGTAGSPAQVPTLLTPVGATLARCLEEARRRAFRSERALEVRALEAERLIDALPEPILVVGSGRRILHGNLAAENLLGSALTGRNLAEVLRSPDLLEGLDHAFGGGQAQDIDFEISGPVERSLRARIAPLVRDDGVAAGMVLVFEDLTALRRTEQMRVDFVANVSHELRTPLSSLTGFIETMQGPAKDDAAAQERFLAIMAEQTGRMGRLVDDLLSLSRIELEEHNPPADTVDLQPLVASMVTMLKGIAAERSVMLEVSLSDDLPPIVGDADQVGQVLRNLIENAIKYGRQGGVVRIAGRRQQGTVAISVSDNGDGIPREHLHRLTERFYRVDAARSRKAGGTGLGLAIVKHILNRHRGRLTIESAPGEGSRFTTIWPIAAEPPAARHGSMVS